MILFIVNIFIVLFIVIVHIVCLLNDSFRRQTICNVFIPNTAVFGPTKLIETIPSTTTTTARMKISDDEDFRF